MLKKSLLYLVKFYQIILSPLIGRGHCRFLPTCSNYSATAITKYGVIIGLLLSMRRLLKCNPFFKGGTDEVK
ncbi:MAG: membrane protein insertion efficiency factor YidD [Rickettsiaceae bacterium]|nr:membrane protein insertion efficiency factor YidD [Rickettsiaceae bacterium]